MPPSQKLKMATSVFLVSQSVSSGRRAAIRFSRSPAMVQRDVELRADRTGEAVVGASMPLAGHAALLRLVRLMGRQAAHSALATTLVPTVENLA